MNTVKGTNGSLVPGASFIEDIINQPAVAKKKTHRGGKKKKKAKKVRKASDSQSELEDEYDTSTQQQAQSRRLVNEQWRESENTDGSDGGWTEVRTKEKSKGSELYPKSNTTATEWQKDDGGLPVTDQPWTPLANGKDTERECVQDLLNNQTSPTSHKKFSDSLRTKVTEYFAKRKDVPRDQQWDANVRQIIWRAVIRANYWWTNPDTGEHTGKPKPIRTPDGVYLNNFELFVTCCAERADRVGRDLPDPEYVHKVEDEVRAFFKKVEKESMQEQLDHLAFLLMFDEEEEYTRNRVLSLEDMQERIGKAFADTDMDWRGSDIFKPSSLQQSTTSGSTLELAESTWQDAMLEM